jgi:hypothetical protein
MPRFLKPLILALVAAALVGAAAAGPAEARLQTKCSADLIHDWYVDGRIDKTYQVHCYREALRDIPEDQVVYGTLREDLTRALQAVIRSHDGDVTGSTPVVTEVSSAASPRRSGPTRPTRSRCRCSFSAGSRWP